MATLKISNTSRLRRYIDRIHLKKEPLAQTDADHLIHELQVHQIELEMQNDELRKTQNELEQARDLYAHLYDFAPISYLTLNKKGYILDINFTGASLLGKHPHQVIGSPFCTWLAKGEMRKFNNHIKNAFGTKEKQTTSLCLDGDDDKIRHITLDSLYTGRTYKKEAICQTAIIDLTDQKNAEASLRESEEKYRLLFSNETDAILLYQIETNRFIDVNNAAMRLYGYDYSEFISLSFDRICADETFTHQLCTTEIEKPEANAVLYWHKNRDGLVFPIELTSGPFLWQGKKIVYAIVRDISKKYKYQEQLRQANKVFESTKEGIIITNSFFNIINVNNAFTRITGYQLNDIKGQSHQLLKSKQSDDTCFSYIEKQVTENGEWKGEITHQRKNGEEYPAWVSINSVENDLNQITNYICIFSDISAIKETEKKLAHLAHHDPLTGLPNRLLFSSHLKQSIEHAKRSQQRFGLLFLDLDQFKLINDTLGHNTGDKILSIIGKKLFSCVRGEDVVARLGGDEFTVVLNTITNPEDAAILAKKIQLSIAEPIIIGGREIINTSSVGISIFPDDADNATDLIKAADTAMYRAKSNGRHTYQFYTPKLTELAFHHLQLEQGLQSSLLKEEFVIHYQPQLDLATRQLVGVEALIRWKKGNRGLIEPQQFIPAAEDSGLIIALDNWVLKKVFSDIAAWRDMGGNPLKVSVNISVSNILRNHLSDKIKMLMDEYQVPAENVEIEITESVFQAGVHSINELKTIKNLGFRLAIDDFGKGYSSLYSLKSLPIDRLKIDRSFIHDAPQDETDVAIIRAIISMAHSLNLKVTAEGVETEAQSDFLLAEKCDNVQGFLYHKPQPMNELYQLMKKDGLVFHGL